MSKTYEGHEEAYNETGARWTKAAPTEPGAYWLNSLNGYVTLAVLDNAGLWVGPGRTERVTSRELASVATLWWSEKLKEPK